MAQPGAAGGGGIAGGAPVRTLFWLALLSALVGGMWLARAFLVPRPAPLVPADAIDPALAAALPSPRPGFARGMNLQPIGWPEGELQLEAVPRSFAELAALGIDHVALIPSFFQGGLRDTTFSWHPSRERVLQTTRAAIRLARAHGFEVMLKPHLWLADRTGGAWRGQIAPDATGWPRWRAAYEETVLAFARLAEQEGAATLSIGSELAELARTRPEFWRALAARVREVYAGSVTYAANWDGEFEQIGWWDALDAVAVDAFFPLVDGPDESLTLQGCLQRMATVGQRLQAVAARTGRPLLLAEIGIKSARGAAYRPWQWYAGEPPDADLQRTAYECVARTFAPLAAQESWLLGAYFWIWRTDPLWSGPRNADFTPRGKPAAAVLQAWFARSPALPTPARQ